MHAPVIDHMPVPVSDHMHVPVSGCISADLAVAVLNGESLWIFNVSNKSKYLQTQQSKHTHSVHDM